MKYGIESYVLNSPYSLISSIILFIGFYKIGKLIFRYPALNKIISSISIINYQYFSFAILFTKLSPLPHEKPSSELIISLILSKGVSPNLRSSNPLASISL